MCVSTRPRSRRAAPALAAISMAVVTGFAAADIVTFETIPGAVPAEGMGISDQFAHGQGSIRPTFLLSNFVPPRLGKYGAPMVAFQGFGEGADAPAPGPDLGQFFLTNYAGTGGPQAALNIGFSNPVARVAGLLLDVDGSDQWTIEAMDTTGAVAATIVVGAHSGPGGQASRWSFDAPSATIGVVRITYSGPSPAGVGLALDNLAFSAFACRADVNYDGFLDGIDYDLFNNEFENDDPTADYNGDGFVDGIDYDQFNNDFEEGC